MTRTSSCRLARPRGAPDGAGGRRRSGEHRGRARGSGRGDPAAARRPVLPLHGDEAAGADRPGDGAQEPVGDDRRAPVGAGDDPGDPAALPHAGPAEEAQRDRDDRGQPDRSGQRGSGRLPQLLRRARRQVQPELHARAEGPGPGEHGAGHHEAGLVTRLRRAGVRRHGARLRGHRPALGGRPGVRLEHPRQHPGHRERPRHGREPEGRPSSATPAARSPAEWASELAPRYAPKLNIVGTAIGGVPVHLAHNLATSTAADVVRSHPGGVGVAGSRAFGLRMVKYQSATASGSPTRSSTSASAASTATTQACGSQRW